LKCSAQDIIQGLLPAYYGDFVLEIGREIWAIEVKASRRLPGSLAAFDSLAKRTKRLRRRIVVFRGPRPQRLGDVEILPLRDFLQLLPGHH
jgi:hypothetical protein